MLSLLFFSLALAQEREILKNFSLQRPYIDYGELHSKWWHYGEDTLIDAANHVRLTPPLPGKVGYIWSKIILSSAQSWEVEFEFKASQQSSYYSGAGLAFWVTDERMKKGTALGNVNNFDGFGLMFDSKKHGSSSFPRIFGILGDGKKQYNPMTDGEEMEIGGCSSEFRGKTFPTKASVKYLKSGRMEVKVMTEQPDIWMTCFVAENVKLPKYPFIGFTAATEDGAGSHDLISLKAYELVEAKKTNSQKPAAFSHIVEKHGIAYFKVFLFLAAFCVIGIVALKVIKKDNKRF